MKNSKWVDIFKWAIVIGVVAIGITTLISPRVKWLYKQDNIGNLADIPLRDVSEDSSDSYMPYIATIDRVDQDANGLIKKVLATDLNKQGKEYLVENPDELFEECKLYGLNKLGYAAQIIPLDDVRALVYPYEPNVVPNSNMHNLKVSILTVYKFEQMEYTHLIDFFGWNEDDIDAMCLYSQNAYDGSIILISKGHIINDEDKAIIRDMATGSLNEEGKSREYVGVDYSDSEISVYMIVDKILYEQITESLEKFIEGFNSNDQSIYFLLEGELN